MLRLHAALALNREQNSEKFAIRDDLLYQVAICDMDQL